MLSLETSHPELDSRSMRQKKILSQVQDDRAHDTTPPSTKIPYKFNKIRVYLVFLIKSTSIKKQFNR